MKTVKEITLDADEIKELIADEYDGYSGDVTFYLNGLEIFEDTDKLEAEIVVEE